jgi:hypothetical protein
MESISDSQIPSGNGDQDWAPTNTELVEEHFTSEEDEPEAPMELEEQMVERDPPQEQNRQTAYR